MCALFGDRPELVSLLLSCGADVAARSHQVGLTKPIPLDQCGTKDVQDQIVPAAISKSVVMHCDLALGELILTHLVCRRVCSHWFCS